MNPAVQSLFPVQPPMLADFAWVNQQLAMANDSPAGLHLFHPQRIGSDEAVMLVRPAPGKPYTVTAGFLYFPGSFPFTLSGIVLRNSGSGKLAKVGPLVGPGAVCQCKVRKMSDPNTYASDLPYMNAMFPSAGQIFVRVVNDGVRRSYSYSPDGSNWHLYAIEPFDQDFVEDQIGLVSWMNINNAMNMNNMLTCNYWNVTCP